MLGLQSNAAEVFQQVSQEYGKAHTGGTVDDAVVEGQAQWAHQTRSELFAVPNRFDLGFAHAQDGNFRSIHDRREACAADTAQAGNSKACALHFLWFELAFAGFFRQFGQLLADLFQAFLIHVFDYWNNQAVWCVGCETDVEVVFQHQVVAIQRGINSGKAFSAATEALMMKANGDSFTPSRSHSLFSCLRNSSNSVISASSCTVT